MMKKITAAIVLSVLAVACAKKEEGPTAPVIAPETQRSISQGQLVGFTAENGAHVWRGIPFAASTADNNRWRAPQPAPGWQGSKEALTFSPRCLQFTNRYDEPQGLEAGQIVGSENCLALNIFAPADAQGKSLPVMLWIHGGGNVWGSAETYDGSRLADNENVIVVTVQYRLGPLGWLAWDPLREAAATEADRGANFAILDLIASLEWVQENISAFGGNPDSVTIFGESAGGHNVVSLLASPLAEGLFHKAIIQSGSFDSVSVAEAEGLEGDLPNPSRDILGGLGVTTVDQLRALPVEEFLAPYWSESGGFLDAPRIIEDGVVLPAAAMRAAFGSTENFNNVPIMTGTNRDEMKLFYLGNEDLTKTIFGVFFVARDQDLYDAASDYASRVWRVRAVDQPASLMAQAGHRDVYAYRFDWDDGGRFLFMDLKKMLGAAHAMEIPFVFNVFSLLGQADSIMFQKKTEEDRQKLSRTMGSYWASFARNGVPSANGAPAWPVYSAEGTSVLRLDAVSDGGIELLREPDSIDQVVNDLRADTRVNDEQKCLIGESIAEWVPTLETEVMGRLGCR
ncbi:carboxylesterase/lipase family protein [Parvularcula sp. IMCC14364]|uniref:carboxylesterase/lipase family protein n=1 Tax=Parvularcula sp. IMCC14364 TaxID=3067902 RepID=UPI002740E8F9|nr:carboxylesterase family protein [Parvularcula sp. IMCC14364]